MLLRAETPPPVYEKIPRQSRLTDPNGGSSGGMLPIHDQVIEGNNKMLWKTKKGIILLSVLATTAIIGSTLGTVLGLCTSRSRKVTMTTVWGPTGTGSDTNVIVSTPSPLGRGSAEVGCSGTSSLQLGSSTSSPGGNISRTSQAVGANVRGTPTAQKADSGSSGESGNTATFGGSSRKASQVVEASSLATSIVGNSGDGMSTASSGPGSGGVVKIGTKPTITSNDPYENTDTNSRTSTYANPQISVGVFPSITVEESPDAQTAAETNTSASRLANPGPAPSLL